MKGSKDESLKKETGVKIRTMRKSRGMTQEDLAKAICQSPSSIAMYENGRREPDFETLEALADVFNVTIKFLVPEKKYTMNLTLFGESDLTPDEHIVLNSYRSLPEEGKHYIHDQLNFATFKYGGKSDVSENTNSG